MNERTQGALLLAVGGIAIRLGLSDAALAYVKAGMQPFLVAAGLVLAALGVGALRRAFREPDPHAPPDPHASPDPHAPPEHAHEPSPEHEASAVPAGPGWGEPVVPVVPGADQAIETGGSEVLDGHAHAPGQGPGAAWLLVLPLLALLLVAPPALGSFAAERQSTRPPVTAETDFSPLPDPEAGAVDLRLIEFVLRALYDEHESLDGVRVRLVGFVTRAEAGSYHLTRFRMACCAADATAISVEITGDRDWPADTWLEVEGYWDPRDVPEGENVYTQVPVLQADASREIAEPVPTYEE